MEQLLGPDEVAMALGVKVDTLRVWRSRGKGPAVCHIGRLCRYREADVIAFIEKSSQDGQDDAKSTGPVGRRAL
jgi:predicted site-specific integrase-resolvase